MPQPVRLSAATRAPISPHASGETRKAFYVRNSTLPAATMQRFTHAAYLMSGKVAVIGAARWVLESPACSRHGL